MKTISKIILILFFACPSCIYGQTNGQKEVARFIITDATENNYDDPGFPLT